MSRKKPKRVKIDGQWYDASEWMGSLELRSFGSPTKYKASEPYVHISNLYFVYDSNGSKIGEFSIDNRSYSGRVTDFEV